MKLWKIARTDRASYDEYDSAVVAAETEDAARGTHPRGAAVWRGDEWQYLSDGSYYYDSGWADPATLTVVLIGKAVDGTPPGIIVASFNAG